MYVSPESRLSPLAVPNKISWNQTSMLCSPLVGSCWGYLAHWANVDSKWPSYVDSPNRCPMAHPQCFLWVPDIISYSSDTTAVLSLFTIMSWWTIHIMEPDYIHSIRLISLILTSYTSIFYQLSGKLFGYRHIVHSMTFPQLPPLYISPIKHPRGHSHLLAFNFQAYCSRVPL